MHHTVAFFCSIFFSDCLLKKEIDTKCEQLNREDKLKPKF